MPASKLALNIANEITQMIKSGIELDRKTLSAMAIDDAASFAAVVETVKGVLGAEAKAA